MSYTDSLTMDISADDAYVLVHNVMKDLDAMVVSHDDQQHRLLAESAPSIWTYGFNFDCNIEDLTATTSRLTIHTTMCKRGLIDTQSKRYTRRFLTVMEAYVHSHSGKNLRAFDSPKVAKAFKSVHGHRNVYHIVAPIVIIAIAVMKIIMLNRR